MEDDQGRTHRSTPLPDRITDWEKTLTPGDRKQTHTDPDSIYNYGTKASGAIKRASLDLTRALANLRRP